MARRNQIGERRRWGRLPLAVPVFVRGGNGQGAQFLEFATALNISAGGVLLALRHHLPRHSQVTVEIPSAPLPEVKPPMRYVRILRGRTVRVAHSERCYLVGLRFNQPIG